ncbi:PP2C family protein-serine/threonine phosphatase [Puniceibacterium sp. IMCC21224]|uniref:PP2C family protein-serine/threonine phosphatase n=1 Tax=Puniceibacterium sp. IMCC21224 TaxID=1618204 RepID=UPI00065D1D17|nr:SpoIIE family protein phosphatase [Puniceibacterium sp. IMCC21224]KMK65430.1 response regulator with CheY-like receiver domain and winged-helix DNA-binding domain [Puniceibacterium sp. IMCC21224]
MVRAAVQRILVVDDSRLQRKIVTSMLDRWGYQVMQAESGEEALDIAQRFAPDLVLSDWMMPGMDGLEFCRQFRSLSSDAYGYFILLTSKSDKGEVAQGLDAGADDFLTKPVNAHELRARINAGARVVSMERELSEKNRLISNTLAQLQTVYDAIDQDLKQARLIQESLVPERTRRFGTSQVSLLLKPCGHVGGDLVGMFSPAHDRLGAYSIDVSGHGITSALVTARVAGYLSSRYPDQNLGLERRFDTFHALRPPEVVATMLNERLSSDVGIEEYLTMLYMTADLSSGEVRLVQAGHPPPLLLRADGQAAFVGNGGLPVGLVEAAQYERQTLFLRPGDRLLLYTDGFSEAVMSDGQMLGDEGLLRLVRETARGAQGPEFLDDLFWRLTQGMAPGGGLEDDVSATLLEFDVLQPE